MIDRIKKQKGQEMTIIQFTAVNPNGQYHKFTLCSEDVEVSFESLTKLVGEGWRLCQVKLIDPPSSSMDLPIGAFDGQPLLDPISQLQLQWETILAGSPRRDS